MRFAQVMRNPRARPLPLEILLNMSTMVLTRGAIIRGRRLGHLLARRLVDRLTVIRLGRRLQMKGDILTIMLKVSLCLRLCRRLRRLLPHLGMARVRTTMPTANGRHPRPSPKGAAAEKRRKRSQLNFPSFP